MQQEAGAPTCLGNSSTPGPSLEAWCSLGFSWSQGTASTITLNAAFPKGQARAGQRRDPQLPASWVLKKEPFLSDTRNRKGAGSALGCVVPCYYV